VQNISQNGGRGGLDRLIVKMYFLSWLKRNLVPEMAVDSATCKET
jgi:hypothetical protein